MGNPTFDLIICTQSIIAISNISQTHIREKFFHHMRAFQQRYDSSLEIWKCWNNSKIIIPEICDEICQTLNKDVIL